MVTYTRRISPFLCRAKAPSFSYSWVTLLLEKEPSSSSIDPFTQVSVNPESHIQHSPTIGCFLMGTGTQVSNIYEGTSKESNIFAHSPASSISLLASSSLPKPFKTTDMAWWVCMSSSCVSNNSSCKATAFSRLSRALKNRIQKNGINPSTEHFLWAKESKRNKDVVILVK